MQKVIILLSVLLLYYSASYSQLISRPAPEILFSEALNQKGLSPANFTQKYVVLDFWATWCGPCVASLPHLSEMSQKYSSDSVVFAIISSEKKNRVNDFLLKRPVKAIWLCMSSKKVDQVLRERFASLS
jgi:thiol-disulfide isomerase/thioredoxin